MPEEEKKGFFEKPESVTRIIKTLMLLSGLSVIADFFYHKHANFEFQGWFGFDAFFGFTACVGLVLAAKQLRKLVMRDEDYYD